MSDTPEPGEIPGDVLVIVAETALFPAGRLLTTPGAEAALREADVPLLGLLARHLGGDWGDLDRDDKRMNDAAVRSGEDRIFSAYKLPAAGHELPAAGHNLAATSQTVWIITEADRSCTTALLPDEY